jgi:signal transduction histidine kinase
MTTAAASPTFNQAGDSGRATADVEYQQLMDDMFHDLSQPLSTLTCLLEVNLLLSRPAKRTRHDLQIALKQTHSIVRLVRGLRELVDAGKPQEDQQVIPLAGCLREVVGDLQPVAEARSVKLSLICAGICPAGTSSAECLVKFPASRLRQAFFHLLEFALERCAAGSQIKISAAEENDVIGVTVAVSGTTISENMPSKAGAGPTAPVASSGAKAAELKQRELKRRLRLAIARRIFETADGSLRAENSGQRLWLEVRLPLVELPK